jgi:GNAT superfamily N-acetyltransferase
MKNLGTGFIVRRAVPADGDTMLKIWQETVEMLAKADSRQKLAPDAAERWQSDLITWLDRADIAVFVAESLIQEGRILGYIIGSLAANPPTLLPARYGFVSDLAVDSHGKLGGLGRALFDALKAWFVEQGVSTVEARVPYRHPVAQAFWRAIGASELYEQMWLKLERQ